MRKLIFLLTILLLTVTKGLASFETMTLLTEEEGALRDAPPGLYEVGRSLNEGPEIEVIAPETDKSQVAPVKIVVRFISRNGREVDLSKFKVEALKFFTIDITERTLPFTTQEGIRIERAKLPSGEHKIRVTIGDVSGGITSQTFVVRVLEL